MPSATDAEWFLYLIRVKSGNLYTGITVDLERRFAEHQQAGPRSAKYLRGRGPLVLVFSEQVGGQSEALKAEIAVKKMSRPEKERLVAGAIALTELLEP